MVVGMWERAPGGPTTWRLNALDGSGGYQWQGMVPPPSSGMAAFTVGSAGRGLHMGQLMVWRRMLDDSERQAVSAWLSTGWGLVLPNPGVTTGVVAIPDAGIPSTENMSLWLDAGSGAFRDVNGIVPVDPVAGGPVAVWRDRSGNGRHARFTAANQVYGATGGPPLMEINGTGVFEAHPLYAVGGGPFCIVAVWRVLASADGGGGHPFNVNGKGYFGVDGWQESIGSATWRVMPTAVTASEMVLVAWHFDGSVLTHRFGSLVDGGGGLKWTESVSVLPVEWTTVHAVTIGTTGKALHLAELMCWTVALTTSQMQMLDAYLRARWTLPTVPVGAATAMPARGLPLFNSSLPSAVPSPYCWLDAANQGGVYADAAGQVQAQPAASVMRLADRGTGGCHCTWNNSSSAVWQTGTGINGLPVVVTYAPGTFVTSPLSGVTASTGYTIIAVWRLASTNGGGHPLAVGSGAAFSADAWTEGIGTDTTRTMSAPSIYGVGAGTVVATCWHGGAGTGVLTWALCAGGDPSGSGYRLTRTDSPVATQWISTVPTVGTAGKGLHLAELLVWPLALSSEQLSAVQGYLSSRWAVAFPVGTGTVVALPAQTLTGGVPAYQWTATGGIRKSDGTDAANVNDIVNQWLPNIGTAGTDTTWTRYGTAASVTVYETPGGKRGHRFLLVSKGSWQRSVSVAVQP